MRVRSAGGKLVSRPSLISRDISLQSSSSFINGVLNPLLSLRVSNPRCDSIGGFRFKSLGFEALSMLFLLAATSRDF